MALSRPSIAAAADPYGLLPRRGRGQPIYAGRYSLEHGLEFQVDAEFGLAGGAYDVDAEEGAGSIFFK